MKQFNAQVFAVIHDFDHSRRVVHYTQFDLEKFTQMNEQGFGIFVTANSFNGRRNTNQLTKLNAVVGDLDIAKDDEQLSEDELNDRKNKLLHALEQYCPASSVVITKNGIQPWYYISEDDVEQGTIRLYTGVTGGLIDVSKKFGALGDEVKDVARLWRVPGFLHQKSEPFLVHEKAGNEHVWTLADLAQFFWREPEKVIEGNNWPQIIAGVTNGRRNISATKIIGKLLYTFPEHENLEAVWQLVYAWNTLNSPPLSATELEKTFISITSRHFKC